jgi:3-oxoacyl-[acyl-carrier protein] reductase
MKTRSSQRRNHVLLVGASRGMGRALARAFLREGKVVSVIGRRPAAKVARDLRAAGYWALDVCDAEQLNAGLRDICRKNGRFTHLICFQRFRGSEDQWQGELATSLSATKRIVEFASDNFDGAKGNSIVFVGSIASQFIAEEQPVGYHAAKAALMGMMRYYAVTLGPRGIRVNAVSPGTVLKDESRAFYLQNKELLRLYEDLTPLRRMGSADEVASVIQFFCSPDASFVTGQNLVVDGGVSVQSHESLARRFRGMIHPQVTRG